MRQAPKSSSGPPKQPARSLAQKAGRELNALILHLRPAAHDGKGLSAALEEMVAWFEEDSWLAGPEPSLADAVFVPFLVREEALRSLGFVDPVPSPIAEYSARVRAGRGCLAGNRGGGASTPR